jgi:hypothetical protein
MEEHNMTKMNQKEAVFAAILSVCGVVEGAYTPSKEDRASVSQILFEGFRAGKIELDREYTDKELKVYVSGLQSNWLRKDKRLNGNIAYVAKNPGSRTGSADPQIKAMRALLATKTDPTERQEIQEYLDKRIAEVKPAKAKVEIDYSVLPEELKHLA